MSEDDFPSGEEILTKGQIAKLALDIQPVVLRPGALPQIRNWVKQWAKEWRDRRKKWNEFQKARDEHRDKVLADARLRDKAAGPPEEGWVCEEYLTEPVQMSCFIPPTLLGTDKKGGKKKGTGKKNTRIKYISRDELEKALGFPVDEIPSHKELIEKTDKSPKKEWEFKTFYVPGEPFSCWTPPELSRQNYPDDRFPLPVPTTSDKGLSWPEKFAALAAVFDEGLVGTTKINPWEEEPDSSDSEPYWQLRGYVETLTFEDATNLRAILGEVEAKSNKDEGEGLEIPVTLDQAAAMVHKGKRTLERWKLPEPDIRGGGGKPHLWYWHNLRPALEKETGLKLPEHFPASRIN